MMLAQITDIHLSAPGELIYQRFDTEAAAVTCINALNSMDPRPDAVLITGDLVHNGTAPEYRNFLDIFSKLEIPYFPMLGNHDSRPVFKQALGPVFPNISAGEFIQFTFDLGPLRIIALDTLDEGFHTPAFCQQRLAWLEQELKNAAGRPVILALHQPPFATGITWLDGGGPGWAAGLRATVARHDNIKIALCGHVHRSINRLWAGTLASVCPSICYQTALDLDQMRARFVLEPPAIRLLIWDGEEIISHLHPLVNAPPPWEAVEPDVLTRLVDYVAANGALPKDINSRERGTS